MLGKLLKYELRATAHYFLPLFAAIVLFSLPISLLNNLFSYHFSWISGLLIFIEVVLIIALAVMTLVITIRRFYVNLLGNEGYLMFTLPVSTHHNILSKLLAATLWNIGAMLVIVLSVLIIMAGGNVSEIFLQMWTWFCKILQTELNLNAALMIFEWFVVGLIGIVQNILILYLALAIGQLANEHKFLASFGAFLGLQFALGTATTIFGSIFTALSGEWARGMLSWLETFSYGGAIQLVILVAGIISLAICAAFYFITHWLLKRKLNLS